MNCPKCGAKVSDKAKFCEECGAQIIRGKSVNPTEQEKTTNEIAKSNTEGTLHQVSVPDAIVLPKKNKICSGKTLFIAIIIMAGVITALAIYNSESNKYKREIISNFRQIVQSINESNEYISDLDFKISFRDTVGDIFASGDIVFKSAEIEQYSHDTMYKVMSDISEKVLSARKDFSAGRDIRYCDWLCGGNTYKLSDRGLQRNGTYIWEDAEYVAKAELYDAYMREKTAQEKNSSTYSPSYITVSDKDDNYWYAVTAAQNLVKDELKSPSTAKFSLDTSAYVVERDGNDWRVSGYIDAQNSFGSTLREHWTVTFTMGDISGSQYKVSNYSVIFS